jgi:divalent metal cation (Fe/Co/Zn/Cd) transporter
MKQLARSERMAIHASNIANLVLFSAKLFASIESRSLAVIASTLDSLLDLISGFILWFTTYSMRNPNQYHYPIGKRRMQPVVRHQTFIFWMSGFRSQQEGKEEIQSRDLCFTRHDLQPIVLLPWGLRHQTF